MLVPRRPLKLSALTNANGVSQTSLPLDSSTTDIQPWNSPIKNELPVALGSSFISSDWNTTTEPPPE